MVIRRLAWLAAPALGVALGSSVSCKVLVEDNCANQSVPGNEFCRELYGAGAPYCSPCRRELNGCVENPPFSCPGYYDEVSEDDDGLMMDESSEGGSSSSSGPATGSGDGSTGTGGDTTSGTTGDASTSG